MCEILFGGFLATHPTVNSLVQKISGYVEISWFCWDLEGLHATGSNNDMWVDLAATNWQLAASYKPQPQIALPLPSFTKIEIFIHEFKTFLFY